MKGALCTEIQAGDGLLRAVGAAEIAIGDEVEIAPWTEGASVGAD